jgi:ribosomal-protein-alanine N-acetyltransferase
MLRGWDEGYIVPSLGMLVDHRFHNCGIGGWLLDRTIEEAAKLGCSRIRLSVYENNKPALRLYLSRGFVEISREKVSIMGRECIKIMMNKTLPG